MAFKTGDIVCLKSGGPVMTVQGEAASGQGLLCRWFDDKKAPQSAVFPDSMLESAAD